MGAYHLSVENRQEDGEQGDRYVEQKIVLIIIYLSLEKIVLQNIVRIGVYPEFLRA